ncbi:ABC transporter ATP-binding protein [Bosea sp. BIWAKO-01]|uniref:ABC transporter ATP-binding protein n=1 Tax=Bosea sp. BIWAKO-01 TaxID=506668 RepID=UPI00085380F1|nr:oligopeptide/dipeptide ABC transporter ATP-binding protein [Bosea sp. BIWAKO-01]
MIEPTPNIHQRSAPQPLLTVDGLVKSYPLRRRGLFRQKVTGEIRAVNDISFSVAAGETLSIVGESGCGKTTAARAILHLVEPTAGAIRLGNTDIRATFAEDRRPDVLALRRQMQYVFQDPYLSLNPRWSVRQILTEPLRVHGHALKQDWDATVENLLERVGLPPDYADRYPHEFSGGQRQRIGIARALAVEPRLLICDEPVSSLDVSVRAQVLNLLADLQEDLGLSYLYISHDLSSVRFLSNRIAVMYLGNLVEIGEVDEIFARPRHHYTAALISAIPVPDPSNQTQRQAIQGEVPSVIRRPSGCVFHTRCPAALPVCSQQIPPLSAPDGTHAFACHNPR